MSRFNTISALRFFGNSSALIGGDAALRVIAGWSGLENCGNLLTNKLDVGNNFTSHQSPNEFGYTSTYGSLSPSTINGLDVLFFTALTGTNNCRIAFAGMAQIPNTTILTLNIQGFPRQMDFVWDGNLYAVVDAELTAYFFNLDGQRVSYNTQFDIIFTPGVNDVTFEGNPVTFNGEIVTFI